VRGHKKRKPKVTQYLSPDPYDPANLFDEDDLARDKVVGVLGEPIDGWVPELVYRYALHRSGLMVDWAIMLDTYRVEHGSDEPRRRVERIDICESEVHVHRFRRSDDPDDDQGERATILPLYAGDEVTVDRQWDEQFAILNREWRQRMRRWIDG